MDKNKIHYCPVGLIQRQFGIYVTGAGMEETKPGEPYPHAYHSSDYYFTWRKGRALTDWEYQILYIRGGTGEIEFEREADALENGVPLPDSSVDELRRAAKMASVKLDF